MKTKKLITAIALLVSVFMTAQSGMNWSAIISDDTGKPLPNQAVDVKFTLNDAGAEVYTETHSLTTSENGFAYAVIGTGTSATNFLDVEWKKDFNLKVEVNSGNGYQLIADKPLQAVPYAKYAQNGLPKATRNQFLNFDGTEWKGVDNFKIIDNQTVGINIDKKIGQGNLIVSGGDDFNKYAGVHANHINANGKPFFGFATEGSYKAWIEYDGETSNFKIYNNDGYKFSIDNVGDVLINNLEGTGDAPVMVTNEGKLYRGTTQKTKKLVISGFNFRPFNSSLKTIFSLEKGMSYDENTFEYLMYSVNLPNGAVVKKATVYFGDNDSQKNMEITFLYTETIPVTENIVFNYKSSSNSSSIQKKVINVSNAHQVNSLENNYILLVYCTGGWETNSKIGIAKVIIEYEE